MNRKEFIKVSAGLIGALAIPKPVIEALPPVVAPPIGGGGYLVPPEFHEMILAMAKERMPMSQLAVSHPNAKEFVVVDMSTDYNRDTEDSNLPPALNLDNELLWHRVEKGWIGCRKEEPE